MAEKPPFKKSEALDFGCYDEDGKKLSRGISSTVENSNIVCQARNEFGTFTTEATSSANDFPVHTFTLPDFSGYSDGFRHFLEAELIEKATLNALESYGRLNWWIQYGVGQKLYPLVTTGDGNCLLHAASLGMWGFHDRLLTLRKALYTFLTTDLSRHALRRRWQWQLAIQNAEAGLIYSKEEWDKEWDGILKLASSQPRTNGRLETVDESPEEFGNQTYESLEEMHVLALAHVLKRPIIIVADTVLRDVNGEPLAPIPFGGVYLPLEIPAKDCYRSPLILSFDASHFCALVAMEHHKADGSALPPAVIPVTDPEGLLLPVQFEVDPGDELTSNGVNSTSNEALAERLALSPADRMGLLAEYLDVTYVPVGGTGNGRDSPDSKHNKKQINNVSKNFGSIGKSMGKKLKKNFMDSFNHKKKKDDSRASTPSGHEYVMAALIHIDKRHGYQEEMISNYLLSAKRRFERQKEQKQLKEMEKSKENVFHLAEQAALEGPTMCINQGCNMYGTAVTSYMCTSCYARQREEEERSKVTHKSIEASAMYGVGKSHFFAESTQQDHDSAAKIPVAPPSKNPSLYLSHSTFYTDKEPPANSYPAKTPVEEKRPLPTYVFGESPTQRSAEKIVPIQIEKRESKSDLKASPPQWSTSTQVEKREVTAEKSSSFPAGAVQIPVLSTSPRQWTVSAPVERRESPVVKTELKSSASAPVQIEKRESVKIGELKSSPGQRSLQYPSVPFVRRDSSDKQSMQNKIKQMDNALKNLNLKHLESIAARDQVERKSVGTDSLERPQRERTGSSNERIIPITIERASPSQREEIIDLTRKPCRSNACRYYGRSDTNGLCSQCYHQRQEGTITRNALLEKLRVSHVQ